MVRANYYYYNKNNNRGWLVCVCGTYELGRHGRQTCQQTTSIQVDCDSDDDDSYVEEICFSLFVCLCGCAERVQQSDIMK